MFESAELGREVSKEDYRARVPELRTELLEAQMELLRDPRFSVVIVIGGVEGAGKGETINTLHEWMDPRFLQTNAYDAPTEQERQRPPIWRFWRDLPPKGRIGVFFGSWYTVPLVQHVIEKGSEEQLEVALRWINQFESHLVHDGVLLLKFWFHISKKTQRKRQKELLAHPDTAWQVSDREKLFRKHYDQFVEAATQAVRRTSTGDAPWTVIEGTDRRYREIAVGEHIRDEMRRHSEELAARPPRVVSPPEPRANRDEPTLLGAVDLSQSLDEKEYDDRLEAGWSRLGKLSRRALDCGASAVLAFEGWDAAGKGGAIRRVVRPLDARYYRIVPVAAPNDEERARPWLWRFWHHLPDARHVTIFDRTWYGRVLVERVEGLASSEEWRRAYTEINEFEESLARHGYGIGKFWLHIDRDEQLRRFEEREQTPHKQFKITEEDYRNREKWDLYEDAVNEMVDRTSTAEAPWTLVPANDKRFARVMVVETVCACFEQAIERAEKG